MPNDTKTVWSQLHCRLFRNIMFFIIPSLELKMSYFSHVILRSINILVPVEFRITKSQKEDKLTTFLFPSLDLCRSHSH